MSSTPPINVEQENLSIEREKLVVEREKLEVEKYKARWTAIGVAVPILVIAATVALGIWSQYQKGRDDFSLKAAEILLQGDSPDVTKNNPNQLSKDFARSFEPTQFGTNTVPAQKELLQLMASRPEDAVRILAMWKSMFPDDKWIEPFEKNLSSSPSFQGTVTRSK